MKKELLKKQVFTSQYRFAEDLVKTAIELRTINKSGFVQIELGKTFLTVSRRKRIKEFFSKECPELEEHVRKFTSRDGLSDYSDQQFLLCVAQLIEENKPQYESEEEFVNVCSKIVYVAAAFLRKNDQSDAINVAVDRVYEMLIDTFYPSTLMEGPPKIKDISDRKYRFSYDLIKNLVKLKGIPVSEWELPNLDNFTFPDNHKQTITELFAQEWTVLDEIAKSFICREGRFDYSDENLSRCMDKIVKDYESEQYTDEELLQVSARVAYAAATFLRENRSNAVDLAVDRIHQMVKSTNHRQKYEQDYDYRFSCDLVKEILGMRSNPLSVVEMSDSGNSFFMVTHRKKIEELLSREKSKLDEVVGKFISHDGSSSHSDQQFLQCIDQITDYYSPDCTSTEEMVLACARIAYVAACFSRNSSKSNAPGLAVDRMLDIIKDVNCLSKSKEEVLIMHKQDNHYSTAYGLVKTLLEIKNVPVSDVDLPDPCNLNLTAKQRSKMEKLVLKEMSRLDKMVENLTEKYEILDYTDGNFIQCMFEIMKDYQCGQKTEKGFVYNCVCIAYTSACFMKKNVISNAAFLAVNRIYEMVKEYQFNNSKQPQMLIENTQDEDYRFAYDIVKTILEIKEIPRSDLDLPNPDYNIFTCTHRNKIKMFLLKERFQLDEMVEKITGGGGCFNYTDNKFLSCMNQIVQEYKSDQNTEEGFLYICARIAYTAVGFLERNCNSNATFLAVNRMYEMSKDAYHFRKRREEAWTEDEEYHFAYDLVKATFEIKDKPFFKEETSLADDSALTISERNYIQYFLSKEWPRLHGLVRRFAGSHHSSEFSDDQFLECMHQILNDYASEQNSEGELLLNFSRIAYVATCFLRKNENSNAACLAVDHIYRMRKKLFLFRNATNRQQTYFLNSIEEKSVIAMDFPDDKYRFAHDLVETVQELQNMPYPDVEFPDQENCLFTSHHRNKIRKLFRKQSTKIERRVVNLTNRDGNLDYSDCNFLYCMDQIFKDYEDKQTTKDGFVLLCARIAYPVTYFISKNNTSNARTLAIERIYAMAKNTIYFNKGLGDKELKENTSCDKYRFAYDLVKAVVEMRYAEMPDVELSDPENFLYKPKHKNEIEWILLKEGEQLHDLTEKHACKNGRPDYSDQSFNLCIDLVVNEYKPEQYTEEDFIHLCSRIAYAAVCYYWKNSSSNAILLAVNRIHEMAKDVFSG